MFVEGKDFQILSVFARKLGRNSVANRSDFAVVTVEGFNPDKVKDFSRGIELTLGTQIKKGVIFDRDYRSDGEIQKIEKFLLENVEIAHIHRRKEIENYLLEIGPLEKAIRSRMSERNSRSGTNDQFEEDVEYLLEILTDPLKNEVTGQYIAKNMEYIKKENPKLDTATVATAVMGECEALWNELKTRLHIVPGKRVISILNQYLQDKYQITISTTLVANQFSRDELSQEIVDLLEKLERFRTAGG